MFWFEFFFAKGAARLLEISSKITLVSQKKVVSLSKINVYSMTLRVVHNI